MTITNYEDIAVIPIRDVVVFPGMVVPLILGREKSIRALERSVAGDSQIMIVSQVDPHDDDPKTSGLRRVGVVSSVLQVLKINEHTVKILIEGRERAKVRRFSSNKRFFSAAVAPFEYTMHSKTQDDILALRRSLMNSFERYTQLNGKINPELSASLSMLEDDAKLVNVISSHIMTKVENRQKILECPDLYKQMEMALKYLELELKLLLVEHKIRKRMNEQIGKEHKNYYLNQQIRAIKEELGEEDFKDEVTEILQQAAKIKLSKEARTKIENEARKLKMMNPISSEASIIRSYIECILELPWSEYSKLNKDLNKAESILDEEHYGMHKIKERILEYLAVNLRTSTLKSPIICLAGPPGVGKTSLVKLIAKATGREFAKISLGGLRDEAEIRGHRKTYVGALPGKVLQAMKKAGKSNPVILLDEIDKLSYDHKGDPASALLEVLDPDQNHSFNDHYAEVDYDISQVMFIATANTLEMIPRPLLDRMEVLSLSGYTETEKVAISKRYLIPKQMKAHGIKDGELEITDDAILDIIRFYTRESGVRSLDRSIAKIVRKVLRAILSSQSEGSLTSVNSQVLHRYLGAKKYLYGLTEETSIVGVTNGLSYSEVGGDLLLIEAVLLQGKGGDVKSTGKLGDVMKESAQTALSFIRAHANEFGIRNSSFKTRDIHIHVPEGATPKDGPSAGIAIATSLVSVLTDIPVKSDVAMTGEITLRGRVLGIGGLKEKLLAALRGGVKKVLIPSENIKDIEELPEEVKNGLEILPVSYVYEVFKHALSAEFKPISEISHTFEMDDFESRTMKC